MKKAFSQIDILYDFSFGSIWWIANRLWNMAFPAGTRAHPGVSILTKKTSYKRVIPFLVGTSARSESNPRHCKTSGFKVRGLTLERGNDYVTVFKIRPILIRKKQMQNGLFWQNQSKPYLSSDEMRDLRQRLYMKGIDVYDI